MSQQERRRLEYLAAGLIALRNKIDLRRSNIPAQTVPVDMTIGDIGSVNEAIAELTRLACKTEGETPLEEFAAARSAVKELLKQGPRLLAWVREQEAEHRYITKRSLIAADRANHFAALAALLEAQGWQPIKTAPKDGTRVLVTGQFINCHVSIAKWQAWRMDGTGSWSGDSGMLIDFPFLWMPLPAPSAKSEAR